MVIHYVINRIIACRAELQGAVRGPAQRIMGAVLRCKAVSSHPWCNLRLVTVLNLQQSRQSAFGSHGSKRIMGTRTLKQD